MHSFPALVLARAARFGTGLFSPAPVGAGSPEFIVFANSRTGSLARRNVGLTTNEYDSLSAASPVR